MYNSSSTILDTSNWKWWSQYQTKPSALCPVTAWRSTCETTLGFLCELKRLEIGLEGYSNVKHMYTDPCTHFHTHTHKQKHLKTETLLTPPHHHHIHTPTLPTSSSHCSAPDCPSLLIRELYSSPWSADNEGCY